MIVRNLLLALALIGLIITSYYYFNVYTTPPPEPPPSWPAKKPFDNAIAASGIIEAFSNNVQIGTPVSGIIKKVYVEVSDKVKKGDPLFELDDRDIIAELYVQEANVAVAKATLKRLQDQLERLQKIKDPRAISQDELKTKENDVIVAEAQLSQALALVKQSKILLNRLLVTSPQEGVVLRSDIRKGEFVQAASTTPVMIIGSIEEFQIRADIDEHNALQVRPNQQAIAYLKNNTEYQIPIEFVRIEPYVIPKKSLTGGSFERVDTRVLQVIYRFKNELPFPVYVGQQVDIYIKL